MDTRTRLLKLYADIQRNYESAIGVMSNAKNAVGKDLDLDLACDTIAVLKKCEDLLRDLKSECNKNVGLLSRVVVNLYMRSTAMQECQPVRTAWVTATPEVKPRPALPKRSEDPDGYSALCGYFGIDPDSPFRPHYPAMVEYVASLDADMKPMPPGISKDMTKSEYVVTCRFHKDTDLETLCSIVTEGD